MGILERKLVVLTFPGRLHRLLQNVEPFQGVIFSEQFFTKSMENPEPPERRTTRAREKVKQAAEEEQAAFEKEQTAVEKQQLYVKFNGNWY